MSEPDQKKTEKDIKLYIDRIEGDVKFLQKLINNGEKETDVDSGKTYHKIHPEDLDKLEKIIATLQEIKQTATAEKTMSCSGESTQQGRGKIAVRLFFTKEIHESLHIQKCLQDWAGKSAEFEIHDSKLDQNEPLCAVCLSTSRLESNIDSVLSQLCISDESQHKNLAVLILHLGTESSLPRLQTSTRVGNESKYADMTLIDVAYDNKKLYKCKMNRLAKDMLQTFIKRIRS